jgi:hypothetical protein
VPHDAQRRLDGHLVLDVLARVQPDGALDAVGAEAVVQDEAVVFAGQAVEGEAEEGPAAVEPLGLGGGETGQVVDASDGVRRRRRGDGVEGQDEQEGGGVRGATLTVCG